jgi:hypothetical protein
MMKALALVILYVALSGLSGEALGQTAAPAKSAAAAVRVEKFLRTELYFGRSKPDGSLVADEDWKAFLAETVTPLFPDGFTVLSGFGQYREKSGKIISEPSQVLIFLYPGRTKKESRAKIEEIRTAYIKRFDQESVLRVDLPKTVNVTF